MLPNVLVFCFKWEGCGQCEHAVPALPCISDERWAPGSCRKKTAGSGNDVLALAGGWLAPPGVATSHRKSSP